VARGSDRPRRPEALIDLVRFACPLVGSALLERALQALDFLAHGLVAAGIGAALGAWGLVSRNRRLARAGLAVLLAVGAAGLVANALKLVFQVPRPQGVGSWSFPSGHATTAFALAAVLGWLWPRLAPLFVIAALFGGLARVFYRDHYVMDVLGGAALGAAIGLLVARRILGPPAGKTARPWAWVLAATVAVLPVLWLAAYEHELGRHLRKGPPAAASARPSVTIEFGTDRARALLGKGWSGDERWNGKVPFVWAEGRESALRVAPLPKRDHTMRLSMIPFVRGRGLSCQVVEVDVNGKPVGRLLLDRGWNSYELVVPADAIGPGPNDVTFRFAHAGRVAGGQDSRVLSVAFRSLEIAPKEAAPLPRGTVTTGGTPGALP
jgi:membrane-associated phospholipid phosphatase